MASRFAVIARSYGDDWKDDQLVARRIAGALASAAPVDVLVWGTTAAETPVNPARRISVRCFSGAGSSALPDHLRQTVYDAVVYIGLRTATAIHRIAAPRAQSRVVIVPLSGGLQIDATPSDRSVLERSDRCLILSEHERPWLESVLPPERRQRICDVGFSLRVHPLAGRLPIRIDHRPSIVAIGDWRHRLPSARWIAQLETLAAQRPGVSVCFVGRCAERLGDVHRADVARATARLDLWRWIRGASAVIIDDEPRCLARDVLESMLLGRPVLAPANAEVTRWHLEQSNGGFWFHAYPDLRAAIDYLVEDPQASRLGSQAQIYAQSHFADADVFACNVLRAVAPDDDRADEVAATDHA